MVYLLAQQFNWLFWRLDHTFKVLQHLFLEGIRVKLHSVELQHECSRVSASVSRVEVAVLSVKHLLDKRCLALSRVSADVKQARLPLLDVRVYERSDLVLFRFPADNSPLPSIGKRCQQLGQ